MTFVAGDEFAELDELASIPDVCEEDATAFCCDDAGAIADELICRTEDEERRRLFREELDACESGVCTDDDTVKTAEHDDTAEFETASLLDSAGFDVIELG